MKFYDQILNWVMFMPIIVILFLLETSVSFFEFLWIKWSSSPFVRRASCSNDRPFGGRAAQFYKPIPEELGGPPNNSSPQTHTFESAIQQERAARKAEEKVAAADALRKAAEEKLAAANVLRKAAEEKLAAADAFRKVAEEKAAAADAAREVAEKKLAASFNIKEYYLLNETSPNWFQRVNDNLFRYVLENSGQTNLNAVGTRFLKDHIRYQIKQAIIAAKEEGLPVTKIDWERIGIGSVKAICEYVKTPEGQQQTGAAGLSIVHSAFKSLGLDINTHLYNNKDKYSIGIGAVGVGATVLPNVWQRTAHMRTRGLEFVPESIKKYKLAWLSFALIYGFRRLLSKNPSAGDAGAVTKKSDDVVDAITGK